VTAPEAGRRNRKAAGPARPTRREFLRLAGLGTGALTLGGCGLLPGGRDLPGLPRPARTGEVREYTLEAASVEFEAGSLAAATWGYGGGVPGPEIRAREGDILRVRIRNRLPEGTTVHWHGLPVPNDMDGVPGVTQPPIPPGGDFVYEFVVPAAGTYLYHSHVGLQLDRGLYGAMVVEPGSEELTYDREYVIVLDDWLDGVSGRSPESALEELRSRGGGMMGGGMGGMMGGGMGGGEIDYPRYLIGGWPPEAPETFAVRRGERVRLRLINAAAETVFRFAVAGHPLAVTHTDGLPVEPVQADTLRIGMGERYDVLLEANEPGVWQVAAAAEGKGGLGRALLRYREAAQSTTPPAEYRPPELGGRPLSYADLQTRGLESFPQDSLLTGPDRTHRLVLSGGMGSYEWTIDGQRYPDAAPLRVSEGEWVRVELQNRSMMAHPIHLHGHFFQVRNATGRGPYKDTALVEAHMGSLAFDFVADNPGEWFFHCHNAYHMESGMARIVSYAGT
jgi:FtsP/CotA-like multicopper oxidase with cupredoxin domain